MSIRSFVLRQGRMTEGQKRALTELAPQYGVEFVAGQALLPSALFAECKQFVLEIGFGNGQSLVEMAQAAPEVGFIGVEVHRPGVGHAMMRAQALGLTNLKLICYDAVAVVEALPAESIDRVQIYFPDPWQKARHHKRRLVQAPFLNRLKRILKPTGELHCATDWQNYAQSMLEAFAQSGGWKNLGNADGFAERPLWRVQTKFEAKGVGKGHGVWDLRYQKG